MCDCAPQYFCLSLDQSVPLTNFFVELIWSLKGSHHHQKDSRTQEQPIPTTPALESEPGVIAKPYRHRVRDGDDFLLLTELVEPLQLLLDPQADGLRELL